MRIPRIRLLLKTGEGAPSECIFGAPFRIGRSDSCEMTVASRLVSREHARVAWVDDAWEIEDLGSTNGLLVNAAPVSRARLATGSIIQLGPGTPSFSVDVEPIASESYHGATGAIGTPPHSPSVDDALQKYFQVDPEQPAGEHTRVIRQALAVHEAGRTRKTRWVVGTLGSLLLLSTMSAGYFWWQAQGALTRESYALRALRVEIAELRGQIEATGQEAFASELAAKEASLREAEAEYAGRVRERGRYRDIEDHEERLIFQAALVFGESGQTIPASFIQAVKDEVHGHWLTADGRLKFREAIAAAESQGFTARIVEILQQESVPPEFFYLALQESLLDTRAVGPTTRWGRAKGMWQFIPTTAERYGLAVGDRPNSATPDSRDDRHDFEKSTRAAARYLRDLHAQLTQASGLLVMAAYNWGEHRVEPRLDDLQAPADRFAADYADVPNDPDVRNYWNFFREHRFGMPDETKGYVLKIFAAAVIGQDPRHFGFEFDNPLAAYVGRSPFAAP